MFNKETYIQRRNRLKKEIGKGILLFLGNNESGMNYTDNTYHFRQDSTFLYFFGSDYAGLSALIDIDEDREIIFGDELTIDDIDLVEANEAFAAQSIAVARELGFDMSKVNVNGGAISIGHPVGASGARIIVTLLHEMLKRDDAKKGLATLCIGGGQGVATIFEKC